MVSKNIAQMIYLKEGTTYRFTAADIRKVIETTVPKLDERVPSSGLLPLRYAVKENRVDVFILLLQHGANPLGEDKDGVIMEEILTSRAAGSLQMLVESLSRIEIDKLKSLNYSGKHIQHAKLYFIERARNEMFRISRHILDKLELMTIQNLKFSIVGQSFAIQKVISDIIYHLDNRDTLKPLVMLFAGTPGHGKTEMAMNLANIFGGCFLKIDCKNHSNSWSMFGSDVGYIGSEQQSKLSEFMNKNQDKRRYDLLIKILLVIIILYFKL